MVKRSFKYIDYFGNSREDICYFGLTKTEVVEYNYSRHGGLEKVLENIVETQDEVKLMSEFKKIILLSYGEKSDDGRRFMKSEEISKAFTETPAYDILMQELLTDTEAAIKFVNSIMPVETNDHNPKIPVDF